MTEYLVIALTLGVAIVGTLGDHFSKPVKVALISLAVAGSAAAVFKSWDDNQDKKFLQLALISTLQPSNSDYARFYSDFNAPAAARGFDTQADYPCHHTAEGLTCFFANPDGSKRGTIVLNKGEVATLYANLIRGASNSSTIEALFKKRYARQHTMRNSSIRWALLDSTRFIICITPSHGITIMTTALEST